MSMVPGSYALFFSLSPISQSYCPLNGETVKNTTLITIRETTNHSALSHRTLGPLCSAVPQFHKSTLALRRQLSYSFGKVLIINHVSHKNSGPHFHCSTVPQIHTSIEKTTLIIIGKLQIINHMSPRT